MQSLCTFTTSSDTFCTAVNEKKKRKHNGASGGWSWGMWAGCGREERGRRSEVEGSKEKKDGKRSGDEEGRSKGINRKA